MIRLTEEMRELIDNALERGHPAVLATASPDGQPGIGFRGSLMVFDDQHLAYWERSKKTGLEHIEANPRVAILIRDHKEKRGWKFFGEAFIYREGPVRDQVMARVVKRELDRDPERQGLAVLVRVDRITDMSGNVLQIRETPPD